MDVPLRWLGYDFSITFNYSIFIQYTFSIININLVFLSSTIIVNSMDNYIYYKYYGHNSSRLPILSYQIQTFSLM